MKYILSILLLVSVSASGQKKIIDKTNLGSSNLILGMDSIFVVTDNAPASLFILKSPDTVKVVMLCSDIGALTSFPARYFNHITYCRFGWKTGDVYLDEKKRPLSKKIMVWMAKLAE